MVRIIMNGCGGRMGRMITEIAEKDERIKVAAGVDARPVSGMPYPVYASLDQVREEADVLVDFSTASAADAMLDWCAGKGMPAVVCTTGLSEAQLAHLNDTASRVALLRSANMSLGVNLLLKLIRESAPLLAGAGFDIEIVEKHHRMKLDAPSGTAIAMAEAANEGLGGEYEFVYDRTERRMQRPVKEIGVSAVRGGTIVGDHDVIFAGEDEVITFSHRAYSRAVFARGAVEAAVFLAGKGPGLYSMADVVL